ncbi:MAG: chromosome segregation protein SMC [Oscillospiraceae bacterium]|nr:chromosome segregation protein SMC [Oscillospiraceae bacterium]
MSHCKFNQIKQRNFCGLKSELKDIEIGLFIHQIDNYKIKLNEIVVDMEIFISQEEGNQEQLSKLEINKENIKQELDKITLEIEQIQNLHVENAKKQEKLNSDIKVFNERIANNISNSERYAEEIEKLHERNKVLEEEKISKIEKKTSLLNNKEKFTKELDEKLLELSKFTETLSEEQKNIEDKKQKLQQNVDLKYEKSVSLSNQDINIENINKMEKSIKNDMDSKISELDNARMNKEEIAVKFREIEYNKGKVLKTLNEVNYKRAESDLKIQGFQDKISTLEDENRIKESRCKFLIETEKEKEGYAKSVKSILKECEINTILADGVHGVLASLISVPKEYEIAIEMCLGGALQNIVTSTEKDAKKLIEFLRKNNLGRASFLPISAIRGKTIDKIVGDDIIGIASNLIKTDKKYEQIIQSLLGRTVVVKDMDVAISLSKLNNNSFRIVTLKGDIINAGGSITGGSIQQKTVNILGRAKEIESLQKEIQKIKENIKKLQSQKEEYISSVENILELAESTERELQEIEIEYATYKEKVIHFDANILKIEEQLEKLKKERADLSDEKEKSTSLKDVAIKGIGDLDLEINELNALISEFVEKNKDNQKYIDDLNFDITNLKISVSSFDESEESINEYVARIDSEIEANEVSVENKQELINKVIEGNKLLEESILNTEKTIEGIENSYDENTQRIEKLRENRIEQNKELDKIDKEISNAFKTIENIRGQISKIEIRKSKIELEIEQIINQMWEEYELTPNNAKTYYKIENVQEVSKVQKQVIKLRTEIKELGSINIDAIEEYKEQKERYDFMSEQRLDLETSSTKLRKVILEMTDIMTKQFSEKFKMINQRFSEVFEELFDGGKAELILLDEDNMLESGIEIEVQPPGKKLQNMSLLSGGERAFTAIALLFAILKINPAPFCVLDEIESALDESNVYRFADYLKKFSKGTQFLVITHRKGTMEVANTVYGVTMEEKGISKLLSIKL